MEECKDDEDRIVTNLSNKLYLSKCKGLGIYEIWIGDRVYVGSSKMIIKRIFNHRSLLRKGDHKNTLLQEAYDKCRESDIIVNITFLKDILNKEVEKTKEYKKKGVSLNIDTGNFRSDSTIKSIASKAGKPGLDAEQIIEIRSSKETNKALSKKYNIGADVISRVRNFKGAYKNKITKIK